MSLLDLFRTPSAASESTATHETVNNVTPSQLRLQCEIEFVSMLSNPHYLQYLAQEKYFEDEEMSNYLEYLRDVYCYRIEYMSLLTTPHSLAMLHLLQNADFRKALLSDEFIAQLHTQQFWHWRSFRYNRFIKQQQQNEETTEQPKEDMNTQNYANQAKEEG